MGSRVHSGSLRRYMPYAYQGHTQEDEVQQLESERRLYVALTRCKISLILLAPKPSDSRMDPDAQPSPFPFGKWATALGSRKRTKPKPRLKKPVFSISAFSASRPRPFQPARALWPPHPSA